MHGRKAPYVRAATCKREVMVPWIVGACVTPVHGSPEIVGGGGGGGGGTCSLRAGIACIIVGTPQ